MTFQELYRDRCQRYPITPAWGTIAALPSDIVAHLPVLQWFASRCQHVTEFGVREGHSTVALVAGVQSEVVSYDIEESSFVRQFRDIEKPRKWSFFRRDTGHPDLNISETDMLFFDTLHTYDHLSKELRSSGRKARHYLAFHDTETCGERDISGSDPNARGIMPAINEFCANHPGEYEIAYQTPLNNGLLVLSRKIS